MQIVPSTLGLGLLCLTGGSGCTTHYVLNREAALRVGAMSESEYQEAKDHALRDGNPQVPVTVQAQKLDLKSGTWLDWKSLRAPAKHPYWAVIPGMLLITLGIGLSVGAGYNQADDGCQGKSAHDLVGCIPRDFKTAIIGGFGGAAIAGGTALTIIGAVTWSPEVSSR